MLIRLETGRGAVGEVSRKVVLEMERLGKQERSVVGSNKSSGKRSSSQSAGSTGGMAKLIHVDPQLAW